MNTATLTRPAPADDRAGTPDRPAIDGAQWLPIGLLRANPKQPRKRFDDVALDELATSIERFGLLQPILVRPIVGAKPGAALFEIVAGERRWRASTRLAERRGEQGVAVVPCIVREMDDFEVLELASVENLQREGLHPLEEAEGYEALLRRPVAGGEFSPPRLRGYTVDELAARVGKSRGYVFGRLKLLALVPEAREAFYGDQISASVALQLARLAPSIQAKALPEILQGWGGEPLSARATFDLLHRRFMLRLAQAPFDTSSTTLLPAAGACSTCPKRTGANPDLFGDVKDADTCTDPDCHDQKVVAHWHALVDEARRRQCDIVDQADELREYLPYGNRAEYALGNTGHVDLLDDDSKFAAAIGGKSPREALGDQVWKLASIALLLRDPDDLATFPPLLVANEDDVYAMFKRLNIIGREAAGGDGEQAGDDAGEGGEDDDGLHGGDWPKPGAAAGSANGLSASDLKRRLDRLSAPDVRTDRTIDAMIVGLAKHAASTAPADRLQPIDLPRPYLLSLAFATAMSEIDDLAILRGMELPEFAGDTKRFAWDSPPIRDRLDKLSDHELSAFIQIGMFAQRLGEHIDDHRGQIADDPTWSWLSTHDELLDMADHLGLDLPEAVRHLLGGIDADLERERAELQAQLDALKPSTPPAGETADKAKPAAKSKKGGKKKAADATEAFLAAQGEAA